MINGLIEKYALAGIDVEEDGGVFVSGTDLAKVEAAAAEIRASPANSKLAKLSKGNVVKMLEFGAIVDLGGGKDGMIHVSELKNGFVKKVEDVVKVGDFVRAKIISVDEEGGRFGFPSSSSRKGAERVRCSCAKNRTTGWHSRNESGTSLGR